MTAHEAPDAILTRLEADHLRARALQLVAEHDNLPLTDLNAVLGWAAAANVILTELTRG